MPGEQFAGQFGVRFIENDLRWDAPGPVAHAAVELLSGEQFMLEHQLAHATINVIVNTPARRLGFR
jgi:hypothetical protein